MSILQVSESSDGDFSTDHSEYVPDNFESEDDLLEVPDYSDYLLNDDVVLAFERRTRMEKMFCGRR